MEPTKDELIKMLSEQLLKLLADDGSKLSPQSTELTPRPMNEMDRTRTLGHTTPNSGYPKSIDETLMDFQRCGIDVNHIREIMLEVDKRKGRTDLFNTSQSLFEQLSGLLTKK